MPTLEYSQPVPELVRQRTSCRTYINAPIRQETRRLLSDYAASMIKGPFGTRHRFELVAATEKDRSALKRLGTYGFIQGATGFIAGATVPADRNLEDYGYLMERIILYATDLGLGTCWLGGTFTKSSFARKISVRPEELMPAVSSVGYCAKKPRLLERAIRRGAKGDRRLPWERLFFDGNFNTVLSPQAAGKYAEALQMVRLGPSASNRQPWRVLKDGDDWHFYLNRTPGYRQRRLVKLTTTADLQRVDMGIAMCHFELAIRQLGLDGVWEHDDPGIEVDEYTEYSCSWES